MILLYVKIHHCVPTPRGHDIDIAKFSGALTFYVERAL